MKQLLQSLRSGKTSVVDVPAPMVRPNTALVRTAVSLVSAGTERMVVEFAEKSLIGKARARPDLVKQMVEKASREGLLTTLEAAFNRLDQPMPLGYSSSGTITAIGPGLQGFKVGQRVACAGGNYAVHAEYAVIPKNLLTPLPDSVDFESAAFTTLGAIALHGFRLAETQVGESVAVIGLGLLGLLTVGLAQAAGCAVFGVDLDESRVALARQMGAQAVTRTHALEAAQGFNHGRGCDAVLICADTSSPDPVELAGELARDRARVIAVGAVGLKLPRKVYFEKELTFINSRSYGPGRYDPSYEENGQDYPIGYVRWTEGRNLQAVVNLMDSGRLDVKLLISHRFPIEQAPQAYALITGKQSEPFLGVLLTYEQTRSDDFSVQQFVRTAPFQPTQNVQEIPGKTVRLGILGAGNFAAAVMLPAIQKISEIEKIAIASGNGANAQHAARKFAFQYAASTASQILEDPNINTIAVLTRHHLHAAQVAAGLSAGKHVFCEKPLALSFAELDEIAQVLAAIPSPAPLLMVGFNRRFAPLVVQLKEFLQDRQEPLAAHYRVNAGFIPLNHWLHDPAQGGGRIVGEGCHFIDLLTFLVGQVPTHIQAQGLPDGGRYREDNVVLQVHFADGSLGTISYLANGDKAFAKEYLEVFSGGRVAVLDDFRSLTLVKDGKRRTYHSRLRQDKGHKAAWQAFAKAINLGGIPPIPYNELFAVSRASLAALIALRTGEKVPVLK